MRKRKGAPRWCACVIHLRRASSLWILISSSFLYLLLLSSFEVWEGYRTARSSLKTKKEEGEIYIYIKIRSGLIPFVLFLPTRNRFERGANTMRKRYRHHRADLRYSFDPEQKQRSLSNHFHSLLIRVLGENKVSNDDSHLYYAIHASLPSLVS